MRLQFEPAGGNKWGSKQWRNSYATHFLLQVLAHYFSFWSLRFISNFQTDKQTACLQKKCLCQTHPRHYEYFKRRRRRTLLPEALHCESLPFAESDFKPFAESDFNPLLRVTPLWDSSLNCQLSWEDFQRQASGNHGKERRGLNKGEIRKKNETRKLRGNRQMKKMIPCKKTFFLSVQGRPQKVI